MDGTEGRQAAGWDGAEEQPSATGEVHDGPVPRTRAHRPGGRQHTPAATKLVAERRTTSIFGAVIAGLQPWEIQRAVAEMQVKERRARAKARAAAKQQGAANPDYEAQLDVPIVWGDHEVPKRTFELYLQKARALLDEQHSQLASQRSRCLAKQTARLDAMYARAVRDGKIYAALKAVELQVDLFGLRELARTQALTAQMVTQADGETVDAQQLPTTPEARATAFAALIASSVRGSPELRDALNELQPRATIMP